MIRVLGFLILGLLLGDISTLAVERSMVFFVTGVLVGLKQGGGTYRLLPACGGGEACCLSPSLLSVLEGVVGESASARSGRGSGAAPARGLGFLTGGKGVP